jgi:transcriptional regulator with XRE-family HTH domain
MPGRRARAAATATAEPAARAHRATRPVKAVPASAPATEMLGVSPDVLGTSIRNRRKVRGLRLSDLSEATALSVSFISQLERGLTNPSLQSLIRIAEALGTTSHELLAVSAIGAHDAPEYQGGDDGALISKGGGYARSLVKGHRAIQPMEIVGGAREMGNWAVHEVDEFMYLCDGVAEVEIEGHGLFVLESGATVYCNAGTRHRWRQLGDAQVRMLLVLAQSGGSGEPPSASYRSHL